jgi:hypothetical protein
LRRASFELTRLTEEEQVMAAEILFLTASLIFALAVIVGANIWALRDPPETELHRSLSKEIEELLDAADRVCEHDSDRKLHPGGTANQDGP